MSENALNINPAGGSKELSPAEYAIIQQNRIRKGELLAQKIYILAVVERISSVDVYREALDEILINQNSEDEIGILKAAQEFFEKNYGTELTKKGVSTKMLDQILHRVGKEHKALFQKLLSGFNAKELARKIWDARFTKNLAKIKESIYELANSQVVELRKEYQAIPRKVLAEQLQLAIFRTNNLGVSVPDFETIQLICKTRYRAEIDLIIEELKNLYRKMPWDKVDLNSIFLEQLTEENVAKIRELLVGFSAETVAEKIEAILTNVSELISERDELPEVHGDFTGRICKNYDFSELWKRELLVVDFINEIIFGYNHNQLNDILEHLEKRQINLTPQLYQAFQAFDPRQLSDFLLKSFSAIAPCKKFKRDEEYLSQTEIKEVKQIYRLGSEKNLNELLSLFASKAREKSSEFIIRKALSQLEFLSEQQLLKLKESFAHLSGITFEKFIKERLDYITHSEQFTYLQIILDQRINGLLHLDLDPDLMELFKESSTEELILSDNSKKLAQTIIELDETDNLIQEAGTNLTSLLKKVASEELQNLEKYFYQQTSGKKALLQTLKKYLHPKDFAEIRLLISGFDPEKIIKDFKLEHLAYQVCNSPSETAALIATFRKHGKDLQKMVLEANLEPKLECLALAVTLVPDIITLNKLFNSDDALDDHQSHKLMDIIGKSEKETFALRFGFNHWFANRFRQFDKNFFTLVQKLRKAVNEKIISRTCFARSILFLEGLAFDIAENLQALLFTSNINPKDLERVNDLLREHQEHIQIIKRIYNGLDQGATLRERIHSLDIDLKHKNKTLLLLDGYDPDLVVRKLHEIISNSKGLVLGEQVVNFLKTSKELPSNKHMPHERNWIPEMYNQIRFIYEEQYSTSLIKVLKERGMPISGNNSINWLAFRLYGEISKTVLNLFNLTKKSEDPSAPFKIYQFISEELENLSAIFRERALDMFAAYFCESKTKSGLRKYFNEQALTSSLIDKIESTLFQEEQIILKPKEVTDSNKLADILDLEFGTK